MKHKIKQAGFTLVELAIVLVIIGLIVGGVLVGQDLIKAATMRKAITEINEVEAGVGTFRAKYNDLPGDLKNPGSYFAAVTNADPAVLGLGNGDGLIQAITTAGGGTQTASLGTSGEGGVFFYEIAQAGYIKEAMTHVDMADVTTAQASVNLGTFRTSVIGGGTMIAPTSAGGRNYLILTGQASGNSVAGVAPMTAGLTPLQAGDIDTKLDDGAPTTGGVVSISITAPVAATLAGGIAGAGTDGTDCYDSTTAAGVYFNSFALKSCTISIRPSF